VKGIVIEETGPERFQNDIGVLRQAPEQPLAVAVSRSRVMPRLEVL